MKLLGKNLFLYLSITLLLGACQDKKPLQQPFEVGIMTDCQYCDCDIKWGRYFHEAPGRLDSIVRYFNTKDLAFRIHLGDFIDKDVASFETLNPIWNSLDDPKHHVLGNHDFDVADSLKNKVPSYLGLKDRYYSFEHENWSFIVLDGNDLSLYGRNPKYTEKQVDSLYLMQQEKGLESAKFYNGGIGQEQLNWLEQQLSQAEEKNHQVVIFSHFPVYPIDNHNIWNNQDLVHIIDAHPSIKAVFTGHNHAGSYAQVKGVHYLTFKAIVDTPDSTAYALARFEKDKIIIDGYGREQDRILTLKKD
ncbi:MAG: metallophosphoesterase [Flavobacteriaceae bacterium]